MIAPSSGAYVDHPMALTVPQSQGLEDLSSEMLLFVAGMGSGKTRFAALKAFQLAEINAPVPVIFAMPTYTMLEDVAVKEMFDVLAEMGFRESDIDYEKRAKKLKIHTESGVAEIWFRSTENPRRLVGPSVASVVVDEAEDNREEAINILISRVRHPRAKVRQFVGVGTPESLGGWFYREAKEQKRDTTRLITSSTRLNHFLPADYIETRLGHFDEDSRKLYVEGEFIARRGRVYTQFDSDRNVVPYDHRPGEWVMGCDFGSGCMAWVMGVIHDDERLHIFSELVLEGSDTIQASRQAAQWWMDYFRTRHDIDVDETTAASMVSCYVDPNGYRSGSISDVRVMRDKGFRVYHRRKTPLIKDRVMSMQEMFARGNLLYDGEGAPYAVRCVTGHCYDAKGWPEKGKPREGRKAFDHANDAAGYITSYRFPASTERAVQVTEFN